MTTTMKAVRLHQYGEADVLRLEDVPRPDTASGEILVRVHAAGINPVDWKTRAGGGMAGRYADPFPLIVGWDVSGVVESVGAGVGKFKPGDEVFGMVRFPEIGSAYAEYVAAPEGHFAHKPANVTHVEASAVPLAALTAWQGLYETGTLKSGQRLLVRGASGGVGHLAVQIAKARGAHVIGTASTPNLEFLESLSVDEIIDYTQQDETAITPVDMVLDTVGGETLNGLYGLVKPGGSVISIVGATDQAKAPSGVKTGNILVHTAADHMAQIADLMAEGKLQVAITKVFPLVEAGQAHAFGQTRTARRGKIVLQVR